MFPAPFIAVPYKLYGGNSPHSAKAGKTIPMSRQGKKASVSLSLQLQMAMMFTFSSFTEQCLPPQTS